MESTVLTEMFEKNPLAHAVVGADFSFVMINDAFCKLIGYSRERLMAVKFTDLRNQNMIKYLKDSGQSVTDALSLRQVTVGQSTFETPSGQHVVVRTNIPILSAKGDVQYIYVTYNEITKIIKNEEFMSREVEELSKIYARMAAGDLTVRYEITRPDEDTKAIYELIVKLRDAVRGIVINLENNIGDVNKKMQKLTATADEATHSIMEGSKGVQQIAQNAGRVSTNTDKVSQSVAQVGKAMQDMSAAIEEITSSMESVSNLSKQTNELSGQGAALAENVNRDIGEMAEGTNQVNEVVKGIAHQMTDIGKIIVLIRDIANQTNLLALNAAIEAARAGEHGRGFAVVAAEVKSLAQESRSSAEKIEEMITQLTVATRQAADGMESGQAIVKKGVAEAQQALEVFRQIQKAAEKVASSATEVAAATEEQAATTEEITASITEVSSLVEQTAKEAGDAAAATEESSAALDEISRMMETVDKVAVEAMEANKKFKVN